VTTALGLNKMKASVIQALAGSKPLWGWSKPPVKRVVMIAETAFSA